MRCAFGLASLGSKRNPRETSKMATSGATSGRRQRDSDEEDDKGEAEAEVPTKRASYYRQKRPVASESDATSQVAAMPPEESAQRQPLEILLSASEEGDLTTVIDCIENNLDIDCMINKAGHACVASDSNPCPLPVSQLGKSTGRTHSSCV